MNVVFRSLKNCFVKRILPILLLICACSSKVQPPDQEALKPSWLKNEPYQEGYYTGIGHSAKDGTNNYVQAAKKSALDDLISQIKVNVSSTSVLSFLEADEQFEEKYEQIIKTTAADELQEFEMVDAWEDAGNYWVYYRLSIARYRQIKEEQKRNATVLASDYLKKGREAEKINERLQAISFYFQAFRSVEKYLREPIKVKIDDQEVLLVNEIYASIQRILDKVEVQTDPSEIVLNRRVNQSSETVIAKAYFNDQNRAAINLPLSAAFEKGAGDVYPSYKTDESGQARIVLNSIGSSELEQILVIRIDIDALSGTSASPVYNLIASTLNVPSARVNMRVQRPVVFLTAEEKSLGSLRSTHQITNKLKNLLSSNGFEFTSDKGRADLWFDVRADSEKGTVSGSIYITYLTGIIKVMAMKEGKEIYATTLDRVKGYGLDYDKSSMDAYNKALETLEKERMKELLNTVLQ